MKKLLRTGCALILAGALAPAWGASGPDLALEEAVAEALRENAALRAMEARAGAMLERPVQLRTLPNPMLNVGGMDPAGDFGFPDSQETRVGIEQGLPWFGKRGLRGAVAEKEAEAMAGDYQAMRRDVVMSVKEAYYDLFALQQVLAATRAEEDVLKRMEEIAQTKYATGSAEQQDVLKAQAEITMLRQRLLELEQQESVLKARLNQLLNRAADSPLGRAATPPPAGEPGEMDGLLEQAASDRPEIATARARAEQAGLERRLMTREYFPDLKLGVESRSFTEGDDMLMVMIGVDLPVWRNKNRAGVREAERMIEATRAGIEAAEKETAYEVQDAYFKLRTARRSLDLYRQALIPQAEARFAASDAGYRAGTTDFLDLLESERFLLEARVMAAMTEGNVGMQWARLERAAGTRLEELPKRARKHE
jgi:outer membrane protein TolC